MSAISLLIDAGKPRKQQLSITDIFNVSDALLQRGFKNPKEATLAETLLCPQAEPQFDRQTAEGRRLIQTFLMNFNEKSFRSTVRSSIFDGSTLPADMKLGHLHFQPSAENQQRYARTVELLVAYLCVKELGALSASFGVHIDSSPHGSDFDCIANYQKMLFYFEVKSGKVRNLARADLQSFLDRHSFLCPEMSVLFLDFQGIADDLVNQAKGLLLYGSYAVDRVVKLERGTERFYALDANVVVADITKSGDVLGNIRSVMRYHWGYSALQKRLDFGMVDPTVLGYRMTVL